MPDVVISDEDVILDTYNENFIMMNVDKITKGLTIIHREILLQKR